MCSMKYQHCIIDKHTIRYLRFGKGQTVLFLHGYGGSPDLYCPLLQHLAKKYDVVAPSMYGTSPGYHPRTVREYIQLTKRFCKKIGLRKYCIVGHSFGGAMALTLAKSAE